MPKSKPTAAIVGPEIDRTSDEVLLWFVGPRSARNAPARDLTHNDIARLAYREALGEIVRDVAEDDDSPNRPDPRETDQARCAEIYAALAESGYFVTEEPAAEPVESAAPAEPVTTEEAPGV